MKKLLFLLAALLIAFIGNAIWLAQQQKRMPVSAPEASLNINAKKPAAFTDANQLLNNHTNRLFTIEWGQINEAPFHIQSGPESQQGYCDVLVERLKVYLADVNHHVINAEQLVLRQKMQDKENLCLPCTLHKSEAEKNSGRIFSQTMFYLTAHGVITTPAKAQQLIAQFGNPINLAALLNSHFRFAAPAGRRFGKLQALIDARQKRDPIDTVAGDESVQYLKALAADSLDFVIDYESTMQYFRRHDPAALTFIPIADLAPWLPVAVSCPDTNWGQLAILRVNAAIDKLQQDRYLAASLQQWIGKQPPNSPLSLLIQKNSAALPK